MNMNASEHYEGFPDDLDVVVKETGVERYRDLTDPGHSAYDARFVDFIRAEARKRRGEPPLPSAASMAKNLASAAVSAARDWFRLAPVELVDARLAVCRSCEWFRPRDRRCAKCGCGTSAKASLRSSRCPLGRWPDDPPVPHDPSPDGP